MTPALTPHSTAASAHGRVNLIGEHTDYNDGFVLPTLIPQRTEVTLRPRSDLRVVVSTDAVLAALDASRDGRRDAPRDVSDYVIGREQARGGWLDYVQGVTWALRTMLGVSLSVGCDLTLRSDVPLGAGLSSSAALEVAVLRALRAAYDLTELDDVTIARVAQRAENDFVGARCGIMDQMASSLAEPSSALFLDTRSLTFRRVPLLATADLVVIHSGVTHSIAGGEYNTRRGECEAAARALGVTSLRDVAPADLDRVTVLPDPLGRRARHVITENARVLEAVEVLKRGDAKRLGALFNASHDSMRDDYEVSVPQVDGLVEIARRHVTVFGARMTGGGFGGSVVVLVEPGTGRDAGAEIAREYAARWGVQPRVLVPAAVDAASRS